uniref:Transporter n=1 Tax=Ascaris suum TaxID=6253 RepID=F1L1U7_ASCSU
MHSNNTTANERDKMDEMILKVNTNGMSPPTSQHPPPAVESESTRITESDKVAITNEKKTSPPFYRSYRFAICILLAGAFFCSNSMRADLGMAMVCMVNSTAYAESPSINASSTESDSASDICAQEEIPGGLVNAGYNGHLLWSSSMQSMLFSATYYGGLITVLPGGVLADRFSPKIILLLAIADYVIVSLFTPLIANANYYAFFVARIFMGFGEGFVLPTMSSLAARWFPASERSTVVAIYTSGNQVATSSISVIGSKLCSTNFLGGWPSIFYLLGIIGILWIALWSLLASSTPQGSRWISKRERYFLAKCVGNSGKKLASGPIPWLAIALSPAMIADLLSTFAANYTATMMQAFLPTFYKDVLLVDLHKNGWFTTAPFLTQLIAKNIMGVISDKLKKSGILSATIACKLFQVVGCILQSSTLFVIAFAVDCTLPTLAVAMLVIQAIGAAAVTPGSMTSLLSIAPNFTGTLVSLSMVAGQIANIAAPNVVALIKHKGTQQEWALIFLVAGLLNVLAGIVFLLFGSAEEQPWAKPKKQSVGDSSKPDVLNKSKKDAQENGNVQRRKLSDIPSCEHC